MSSDGNREPPATVEPILNDPPAKWGTPGEYCYCTTGSSDYCEFCDAWVGKCWCWNEDDDDEDNGLDDD